MPPNGLNINGQYVTVPGPYGQILYQNEVGNQAPVENIAVVGEFPFLPGPGNGANFQPVQVTSKLALTLLCPDSTELARVADILYNPASDPNVAGAPNDVVLVNAKPNTQAYLNLLDSTGAASVLLKATQWGLRGNQTKVAVVLDGGVYDITISRGGTEETYNDIEPLDLFTLVYTGSDFSSVQAGVEPKTTIAVGSNGAELPQATINVASTAQLGLEGEVLVETDEGMQVVAYTGRTGLTLTGCSGGTGTMSTGGKVRSVNPSELYVKATGTEAIGTQAYGLPWDGLIQITASTQPASGETYTVTITGLAADGSEDTLTLTWTNTDPASTTKTTTTRLSYLTQIVFAQAGGTPTTPSFTVTGDIIRATDEQFPTVGAYANYWADYAADFTVTDVSDLASSILLGDIDPIAPTSLGTPGVTYSNATKAIVNALAASALVTAEAVEGGGAPVQVPANPEDPPVSLAGGSEQPSTTVQNWTDAIDTLRRLPVAVEVVLNDQEAVFQAMKTHLIYMAGIGRNPRNGYVGTPANRTLAQMKATINGLNTRHMSVCGQEIQRISVVTGNLEWLPPKWQALLCGAMQVSTLQAITFKQPNVTAYRSHSSWDTDVDPNVATTASITAFGQLVIGQAPIVTRVLRGLTTYRASSDPSRTDIQPNRSLNRFLNFAYAELTVQVGTPTTVAVSILRSFWKDIGTNAVGLQIIEKADTKAFTVDRIANINVLGGPVGPAYSNDFFPLNVSVMPTQTGGFTLNLNTT